MPAGEPNRCNLCGMYWYPSDTAFFHKCPALMWPSVKGWGVVDRGMYERDVQEDIPLPPRFLLSMLAIIGVIVASFSAVFITKSLLGLLGLLLIGPVLDFYQSGVGDKENGT